jgi:hypothetical protein
MSEERHNSAADQNALIAELRELRRRAREIYRDLDRDLRAFQQPDGTFSTFPSPKANKIHVTTTCTALMALTAGRSLSKLFPGDEKKKNKRELAIVFPRVVRYRWMSEGLEKDNAFSVAFVLRAAGFLVTAGRLKRRDVLGLRHDKKSLKSIALETANRADKDFNQAFSVGKYPPKAAILYWYVDGIDLLDVDIGLARWQKLVTWAGGEFTRQLAHVASENAALMDPIAMVMAACLATRLRKIMNKRGATESVAEVLPSTVELNEAISLLFKYQTRSGIWPKYFPMFHFKTAGANYCFTFEMLEALVSEMGDVKTFELEGVLAGLSRAVEWCTLNRLRFAATTKREYSGWNSGGNIATLRAGVPESWATATVHWFLHKLDEALSNSIEHAVLKKYGAIKPTEPDQKKWKDIADSEVLITPSRKTVKGVLKEEFLIPLGALRDSHTTIHTRRSALLFGPPGTAKTTLVREMAHALGWQCVELRPSNFLVRGLENIYVVADEIFNDLMDLTRTVVFFDEMDALLQSRDKPLDVTQQFLTTTMLPKLAELHDQGHIVFLVATNYRKTFDEAITRSGRFDLWLFVGPPTWSEKLKHLAGVVNSSPLGHDLMRNMKKKKAEVEIRKFFTTLKHWTRERKIARQLALFTYGEFRSLLEELLRDTNEKSSFSAAVHKIRKDQFIGKVQAWARDQIILRSVIEPEPVIGPKEENKSYANYLADRTASRRQ